MPSLSSFLLPCYRLKFDWTRGLHLTCRFQSLWVLRVALGQNVSSHLLLYVMFWILILHLQFQKNCQTSEHKAENGCHSNKVWEDPLFVNFCSISKLEMCTLFLTCDIFYGFSCLSLCFSLYFRDVRLVEYKINCSETSHNSLPIWHLISELNSCQRCKCTLLRKSKSRTEMNVVPLRRCNSDWV